MLLLFLIIPDLFPLVVNEIAGSLKAHSVPPGGYFHSPPDRRFWKTQTRCSNCQYYPIRRFSFIKNPKKRNWFHRNWFTLNDQRFFVFVFILINLRPELSFSQTKLTNPNKHVHFGGSEYGSTKSSNWRTSDYFTFKLQDMTFAVYLCLFFCISSFSLPRHSLSLFKGSILSALINWHEVI